MKSPKFVDFETIAHFFNIDVMYIKNVLETFGRFIFKRNSSHPQASSKNRSSRLKKRSTQSKSRSSKKRYVGGNGEKLTSYHLAQAIAFILIFIAIAYGLSFLGGMLSSARIAAGSTSYYFTMAKNVVGNLITLGTHILKWSCTILAFASSSTLYLLQQGLFGIALFIFLITNGYHLFTISSATIWRNIVMYTFEEFVLLIQFLINCVWDDREMVEVKSPELRLREQLSADFENLDSRGIKEYLLRNRIHMQQSFVLTYLEIFHKDVLDDLIISKQFPNLEIIKTTIANRKRAFHEYIYKLKNTEKVSDREAILKAMPDIYFQDVNYLQKFCHEIDRIETLILKVCGKRLTEFGKSYLQNLEQLHKPLTRKGYLY